MPGMTATSSSCAVKVARYCCSFGAALGAGPFFSTRFFAAANCCACAAVHSSGGAAITTAQSISPTAKPEKMRSLCTALLRSLRRVAVRQDFSIRDYGSSHQGPLVPVKAGPSLDSRLRGNERRVCRRVRSTSTRAPYAGAGSVGALAAPAPTAGAARKPARAERVLRAARHPHGHASGWRYASRQAHRSAARVINHSSADRYAVAVRWVARTAPGDDSHAPWAVERRCKRGRAGSEHRNGEERRQRDGADGMANHGDPRLAAPFGSAWLIVLPFFHHGQSDGWPRSKLGAAWLAEGIRRKKGPSPSALLKWTVAIRPMIVLLLCSIRAMRSTDVGV